MRNVHENQCSFSGEDSQRRNLENGFMDLMVKSTDLKTYPEMSTHYEFASGDEVALPLPMKTELRRTMPL